jgi:long-chain acyl-CoA synthetase
LVDQLTAGISLISLWSSANRTHRQAAHAAEFGLQPRQKNVAAKSFPISTGIRETPNGMAHESLAHYFRPDSRPAREIAVAWRHGYRMERWAWAKLSSVAVQFARELEARGIGCGERVFLWGPNTGEWLAVFIGCLLRGAIVVPMDAIAAPEFARRVIAEAAPRLAVISREMAPLAGMDSIVLEDLVAIVGGRSAAAYDSSGLHRGDALEIVFTSGTTAEPRGVVLTHGNVLSNLEPIEREILRYRKYERFFHPLKFLNLLPLSHVFGQMLGIFIPQILGATSIFLDSLRPADVAATIRRERVSVLVTVPRLIESLRDKLERDLEAEGKIERFRREFERADGEKFLRRWWRFRRVHARFGQKFWAIISGGAALPAEAEKFWSRIGYAVIQGYGLTETTSLVSLNHPFHLGRGSIGKAMPGIEVKLDANGEILVRGENVSAGYWKSGRAESALGADGWFRTGDLGERDAEGNLYFRGRQKNVIVTPEGMNVFPEDIEAKLRTDSRVRDCVVLGIDLSGSGNEEPCAVLFLRELAAGAAASAEGIVRLANESLASYQRIRRFYIWPDQDFPRTPTQKPMLAKIRLAVTEALSAPVAAAGSSVGAGAVPGSSASALASLVARMTNRPAASLSGASGLATDLNLSSVDRVELMSAIEERYQVDLNEMRFSDATTLGDLEKLISEPALRAPEFVYPRWVNRWPVPWIRVFIYYLLTWPATMILAYPKIRGREHLRGVGGPILVACNHVTYLDVGFVLAALPPHLRHRLAVSMDGENLAAMRRPPKDKGLFRSVIERISYVLVVSLFNVFPLPRRSGYRESFGYAGELTDGGESILIFPEGELTPDGEIAAFRPGIGLLASRLGVPVVPMRIDGLYAVRMADKSHARPGTVRISIGAPMKFEPSASAEEITAEIETRVRGLAWEVEGSS